MTTYYAYVKGVGFRPVEVENLGTTLTLDQVANLIESILAGYSLTTVQYLTTEDGQQLVTESNMELLIT